MKYLMFLAMVVAAWFYMTKGTSTQSPAAPVPVAQPAAAVAQTQPPSSSSSNSIKRPLDRAHAVADMVRKQKAGENF